MVRSVINWLNTQISIAPLVVFRIVFGTMMFLAVSRFLLNGWVEQQYVSPGFYFSYFGTDWMPSLSAETLYLIFGGMLVSALGIALGFYYRLSAITFFILFSFVEFLDKSNYLNHYYFVTIVSGLMIFLPAGRSFSIDTCRNPLKRLQTIPRSVIFILQLQLALVYFFAGIAKVNHSWLIEAMPLRIWLPPHEGIPVIGHLFTLPETAYVFSWFGCIYDLTIPFFLFWSRSRPFAYVAVIAFHAVTALLFQIGMFPWIMILSTLIFFSPSFHERLLKPFAYRENTASHVPLRFRFPLIITSILFLHFTFQLLFPLRHWLYPGELFWTENGYRFSWRVMLMEKAGTSFFYVRDKKTNKEIEVTNSEHLTPNQEKMMATQPDMILQYASYLKDFYSKNGFTDPEVRADIFVTLNGQGSRRFIDPNVNLAELEDGFSSRPWVLPYQQAPWLVKTND